MAKFVWPVITGGIASRNKKIQDQLDEAERVHAELKSINQKYEIMLAAAKSERDAILNEARVVTEKMKEEALLKAEQQSQAIIEDAKKAINYEKLKAITDVKNEIANLSIEIAEKVIGEELKDEARQKQLIEKWVKDCNLN